MASFDLAEAPRLLNEIKNLSGLNTEETQKFKKEDSELVFLTEITISGFPFFRVAMAKAQL